MTPEQQRLAITKVLHCNVPAYLSDLNAMHEAEKMLTSEMDCERYSEILTTIVNGFYSDPFRGVAGYLFHASATQRAEAFLRTLNLWTDK